MIEFLWGAPAAALRRATRSSGVGLATGCASLPCSTSFRTASLRSRPPHPSPD
ncbi:MAG: hypothetical protein RML37_03800 [Chitinophagales bacterium]|nr:hypothetical protein [Chitinophagales bacterium]